jgi:hypothetical protein
MKRVLLILVVLSLCGCTPPGSIVKFEQQPQATGSYVSSAMQPDNYPSFPLGEGNIYSCRYGIHYYAADEFSPSKLQVFSALLASEKPAITSHKVELNRFDVYRNWRLRLLSRAGSSMGGALGYGIARNADEKNNPTASLPPFLIQEHPGNGRSNDQENQIGCDGKAEGEYYPSQVNGGSDVIVTWLSFTVDGKAYDFRSTYQFHFDAEGGNDKAVRTAVTTTIKEAAAKISQ